MPLPPYIKRNHREPDEADRRRYQTVYARAQGAIAAPTAGLHFTDGILSRIREHGITVAAVTLHVGYGTFVPVRVDDIRDHRMHEEWFSISEETARMVNQARTDGPTGGGRRHHQRAHPRVCGPVGRPGGAGVRPLRSVYLPRIHL
jgi:S-adenosylmethionine:tRNA ribosyltransferase-isomerase